MSSVTIEVSDMAEYHRVSDLVKRTSKENPKPEDRAALRRELASSPKLWRFAGDMARRALDEILVDYAGESVFVLESIHQGLSEMRRELGYESAPMMERMLIEQVLICWLRLNLLEKLHWTKTLESHSSATGLYWDRRLSTAQRRLTRATESLAKVRRLAALTPKRESAPHAAKMETPAGALLKAIG
jgi:hypothetical protein